MNIMSEFMGLIYGVYDAKTGDDLTRTVLLQIAAEVAPASPPA
mgnify:CR=1 FL=1